MAERAAPSAPPSGERRGPCGVQRASERFFVRSFFFIVYIDNDIVYRTYNLDLSTFLLFLLLQSA
jgi:hypothetical protein